MIIWVDAQISPAISSWLTSTFNVQAKAVRDLGLRDAKDEEIFFGARKAGAAVMSKDRDFLDLLRQHGPPPQVLWITTGNTSNANLQAIFQRTFEEALELLRAGEALVEIG